MLRKSRFLFIGIAIAFLLVCSPLFLKSENIAKGNVIGFVYDRDGTTPLEGAAVKFKNVSTSEVYESSKSDSFGIFKIEGLEKGIYIYGVVTAKGDFNANGLVGVRIGENETAKLSISLTPYEKKVASAIQEVYREQKPGGESLVGRVVNYDPDTRIAEVFITNGLLRMDDMIYARGENTDFYQDVKYLEIEDSPVKNLFSGQTAFLAVKKEVKNGDLIYKVWEKGILPIFSRPIGDASVIAGDSRVVYGTFEISCGWWKPCSPFAKWNWEDMWNRILDLLSRFRKGSYT